jgi:chromosome segregation ATPase
MTPDSPSVHRQLQFARSLPGSQQSTPQRAPRDSQQQGQGQRSAAPQTAGSAAAPGGRSAVSTATSQRAVVAVSQQQHQQQQQQQRAAVAKLEQEKSQLAADNETHKQANLVLSYEHTRLQSERKEMREVFAEKQERIQGLELRKAEAEWRLVEGDRRHKELQNQLDARSKEVAALRSSVDAQSVTIRELSAGKTDLDARVKVRLSCC